MRDEKSGFKMSYSLLCTVLMLVIAATYLLFNKDNMIVNACMIPITLVCMLVAYSKDPRKGMFYALILGAALGIACLCFFREQLSGMIFWVIWTPTNLFFIGKLRTGVAGLTAERDFYRGECERVSMVDPITRMRNRHAFLNDAPIYIKIARRYQLQMLVVAISLRNNAALLAQLGEAMHNEMLEEISRLLRRTVRTEDLAYLVDNRTGMWCISMFTNADCILIVIDRIRKNLETLSIKDGNGTACAMEFAFGYTSYDDQADPAPSLLLRQATENVESKSPHE